MQEIKKRRIVIASVLKPVDDTRMFEKIGRSLSQRHEVHVIGSGEPRPSEIVKQHGTGVFGRLSFARVLAPWRVLQKILTLKPDLVIICTHELLWQALIARIFLRCRIWYDVQENYARNILSTRAFPSMLRRPLAAYVRMKERLSVPAIEHFLLAEQNYADEMPYLRERAIIVENKVRRDRVNPRRRQPGTTVNEKIRLLFTGTLSESTGVFTAVDVAEALNTVHPVELTIAGFAPSSSDHRKIVERCAALPFVVLKTGRSPVSHDVIMNEIAEADLGIICYPENPVTWACMPTKLYEYIGSRLPVLLIDNPKWVSFSERFNAAMSFHPPDFRPADVLAEYRSRSFYNVDPQDVYWESEERKLMSFI